MRYASRLSAAGMAYRILLSIKTTQKSSNFFLSKTSICIIYDE